MASLFGHGIVGFTIAKLINNQSTKLLVTLAVCSSILPDLNIIAINFGTPY